MKGCFEAGRSQEVIHGYFPCSIKKPVQREEEGGLNRGSWLVWRCINVLDEWWKQPQPMVLRMISVELETKENPNVFAWFVYVILWRMYVTKNIFSCTRPWRETDRKFFQTCRFCLLVLGVKFPGYYSKNVFVAFFGKNDLCLFFESGAKQLSVIRTKCGRCQSHFPKWSRKSLFTNIVKHKLTSLI